MKNVRHWAQGMGWNPVCSRGAAVEADAIGRAAVEADAIGERRSSSRSGRDREQQLKRAQSGSSSWRRRQTGSSSGSGCRNRAREQQLKRTQAVSSSWSGRNRGEAALQRAVRRRTVGEVAERAKRAQLLVIIKILMCVCVWRKWDVRGVGLD